LGSLAFWYVCFAENLLHADLFRRNHNATPHHYLHCAHCLHAQPCHAHPALCLPATWLSTYNAPPSSGKCRLLTLAFLFCCDDMAHTHRRIKRATRPRHGRPKHQPSSAQSQSMTGGLGGGISLVTATPGANTVWRQEPLILYPRSSSTRPGLMNASARHSLPLIAF